MAWKAWDVRAQLFTILHAAKGTMPAGTEVFDGPRPKGAIPKQFVVVGVSGVDPTDFSEVGDGVDARQEWSSEGPGLWRDEAGTVSCTIIAWTGQTDFAGLRDTIETIVGVCESAVAANPTLNGSLRAGDKAELVEVRMSEMNTAKGAAVGAVATWAYRTVVSA